MTGRQYPDTLTTPISSAICNGIYKYLAVMYSILVHTHSGLRWVVLLLIFLVILNSISGLTRGKAFTGGDRTLGAITMGVFHLQVVLGLILFFMSPKVQFSGSTMSNALHRFFTVEHIALMLVAAVLITLGYIRAKRANADRSKFSNLLWYFLVSLLLVLAAIPWPFREGLGGTWY